MKHKSVHVVRHLFDFSLLATIIGLGLVGVLYYRFDIAAQISVVLLMSTLYIFWGVFHHFQEANLTAKVILEYISVAALVALILIIVLLRT